jgi:hypothetical protein
MIWEMAVNTDETPRLHHYSLFNNDRRHSRIHSNLTRLIGSCPTPWWKKPLKRNKTTGRVISVKPRALRSCPQEWTWTVANRFLNLGDTGMLTACKESRSIFLAVRATLSGCGHFVRVYHHGGEEAYNEISAKRDIICFSFSPNELTTTVSLDWGGLLSRLPFFRLPQITEMNLAIEFDDSWVADIKDMTRENFPKFFAEASLRGVVIRAHWDWQLGRVPRWTRLWLIDRGGGLPANYRVGAPIDCLSDDSDTAFFMEDELANPRPPDRHDTFVDGRYKYVESYDWERGDEIDTLVYSRCYASAPVLEFIAQVHRLSPVAFDDAPRAFNRPEVVDYFFRVLRQLDA